MGIANLITGARFLLIPLLFGSIVQETIVFTYVALISLILIILGDIIDGYVARKKNQVTKIGSVLDPITNKIAVYGLLIFYSLSFSFFIFPLLVFLARDVIVNICRFYLTKNSLAFLALQLFLQHFLYKTQL